MSFTPTHVERLRAWMLVVLPLILGTVFCWFFIYVIPPTGWPASSSVDELVTWFWRKAVDTSVGAELGIESAVCGVLLLFTAFSSLQEALVVKDNDLTHGWAEYRKEGQ